MAEYDLVGNNPAKGNTRVLPSGATLKLLTRALFDDEADVASSGSPTVLATNSIAADTLISNGGTIHARYFGIMAANANERSLTLKFAGTTIFNQLYDETTQDAWAIDCTIIRESSSAVKCFVTIMIPAVYPLMTYTRITSLNLTSNAYNLELTADQTSNADVTFKFSKGTYTPGI